MTTLEITSTATGHDTMVLDPTDTSAEAQAAIKAAERIFAERVGKGALAYAVDPVTKDATQVRDLDLTQDRIVIVPQPMGG